MGGPLLWNFPLILHFFLNERIREQHLGLGESGNKGWTLGSGAEEGVRLKSYHRSDEDVDDYVDDDDNDDDDNDDDDDDDNNNDDVNDDTLL